MPTPSGWTFFDFRNERGENEIVRWTKGPGKPAKARLNALVRNLSVLPRPFDRQDKVGLLRKSGPCHGEGFIELIIKVANVQYRPIGWYGPDARTVTLLVGATERDGEFDPRNACEQAVTRKRLILSDRRKHLVEHDYS
jgi:hypothetical protein